MSLYKQIEKFFKYLKYKTGEFFFRISVHYKIDHMADHITFFKLLYTILYLIVFSITFEYWKNHFIWNVCAQTKEVNIYKNIFKFYINNTIKVACNFNLWSNVHISTYITFRKYMRNENKTSFANLNVIPDIHIIISFHFFLKPSLEIA